MMKYFFYLLLVLFLHSACSTGDDGFFPLKKGQTWTYQHTLQIAQETSKSTFTMRNAGSAQIDGTTVFLREDSDGNSYGIKSSADKIERVASKSMMQAQLEKEAKPLTVMKLPLSKGATWTNSTVPYVLRRVSEFPPELKHNPNHRMNMEFEVMALDATVGTYTGCAHILGKAGLKLFVDPMAGFSEIPITQDEWYCPKVGLVKLLRKEPVNSRFLLGGEVQLILTEFKN
ncbi:MAG: hypothetical protein RLZZ502_1433 [Pseudomonadota bacterium]|jgi:hypothetical protein